MTAQEIGQLLIAHDALAEEEHDDHDDDGDDRHAEAVLEEARRRDAEELAGIQTAQQQIVQSCALQKSRKTGNGLKRIKVNNPACALYEKE